VVLEAEMGPLSSGEKVPPVCGHIRREPLSHLSTNLFCIYCLQQSIVQLTY
jgi:hypothetical protein